MSRPRPNPRRLSGAVIFEAPPMRDARAYLTFRDEQIPRYREAMLKILEQDRVWVARMEREGLFEIGLEPPTEVIFTQYMARLARDFLALWFMTRIVRTSLFVRGATSHIYEAPSPGHKLQKFGRAMTLEQMEMDLEARAVAIETIILATGKWRARPEVGYMNGRNYTEEGAKAIAGRKTVVTSEVKDLTDLFGTMTDTVRVDAEPRLLDFLPEDIELLQLVSAYGNLLRAHLMPQAADALANGNILVGRLDSLRKLARERVKWAEQVEPGVTRKESRLFENEHAVGARGELLLPDGAEYLSRKVNAKVRGKRAAVLAREPTAIVLSIHRLKRSTQKPHEFGPAYARVPFVLTPSGQVPAYVLDDAQNHFNVQAFPFKILPALYLGAVQRAGIPLREMFTDAVIEAIVDQAIDQGLKIEPWTPLVEPPRTNPRRRR